jgi:hypothetical protein
MKPAEFDTNHDAVPRDPALVNQYVQALQLAYEAKDDNAAQDLVRRLRETGDGTLVTWVWAGVSNDIKLLERAKWCGKHLASLVVEACMANERVQRMTKGPVYD